jgi:UDP-N-acetylmuramoylalanine--D-glutamate ligase
MLDLGQAKVIVAGHGLTGQAVAKVLHEYAKSVITVADDEGADLPMPTDNFAASELLSGVDLVVTSPGIPPSNPLLAAALSQNIPVWSEVELAWQLRDKVGHTPAKWLAVTGTNGKTTTVGMLESIIKAAGQSVKAVGNVGPSLLEAALDPELEVLVVELSSFQLHFTTSMAAEASAILNIAPDHLDWHGGFENYAADKGKIYTGVEIAGIYNVDDPLTEKLIAEADVTEGARAVGFTLAVPQRGMVGVVDDVLVDRAFHLDITTPGREKSADELATFADLRHLSSGDNPPPHIIANALAAAALARAHGVPLPAIAAGLRAFDPGAHRIAKVATIADVTYVDDSKATNAHAAAASLQSFNPGTVVWIVGGLAKGATFDELVADNAAALRAAVVIGVDQTPFIEALSKHASHIPTTRIDSGETTIMRSAVAAASAYAQSGDTVLLAPAGASQDQFRSYAHRGEAFIEAVNELK